MVLTSVAALVTAWCAFQATVWSGVQTFRLTEANDHRRRSVEARIEGTEIAAMDAQQLIAWMEAQTRGEEQLATLLFARFRPELKDASTAWLEQDPFENPNAPPSPMALERYHVPEFRRALALEVEADKTIHDAHTANHHADMYMLATVLLAAVLFIAASGPKNTTHRMHRTFLTMSIVFLLGALAFVLTRPVLFTAN